MGETAQIRAALIHALDHQPEIELDTRDLAEVDLSFVQLVLAARSDAERAGKSIRLFAGATDALAALLQRGGFLSSACDDDRAFWFHGEKVQ